DAARVAVRGPHDRCIGMIGEDIRSEARRHVFVQPLDIREASAEHNDVWIDNINHARQCARHPALVNLQSGIGGRVTRGRARRDKGGWGRWGWWGEWGWWGG